MNKQVLAAVLAAVLALVPVALGANSGPPPTGLTLGTVSRVIDGDTLVLRNGARVRLVQIDAPEAGGECHAAAATRELIRLAGPGRRISLEADPLLDQVDRYGRLLRYVNWNGTNVNVELVSRGAATSKRSRLGTASPVPRSRDGPDRVTGPPGGQIRTSSGRSKAPIRVDCDP
jgi:endonuclease YncB( thermonuclease family)